jgi:amidase
VIVDPGNEGVHPAVKHAIENAADVLQKAGYEPELAEVPRFSDAIEVYGKLIMTEFHFCLADSATYPGT